ncbi:MAG: hypothetical protein WCI51_16185 [Lentisphaerota bacterium]
MKKEDYSGEIFLTFVEFIFAAFLLISCGCLIYFNAHETSPDELFLLRREFMPSVRGALFPELRERTTFIYLTLLSIPIGFAVIYICEAFQNTKQQIDARSMLVKTVIMNIFILTIMAVCFLWPQFPPAFPKFIYLLFGPALDNYAMLLLAPVLSFIAIYGLLKFNLNLWFGKFLFPLLMLIPLLQILYCRIYTLDLVSAEVPDHPNIIAYAISQATAGGTDYHQYGFYQRMLAPVFKMISPSMLNISAVMAILFWAGCLSVYWVLFKCMKNKALIPAFALVLFLTTGGTWFFSNDGRMQISIEPYFAYYPIRFLFPALSVLLFSCLIFFREKYIAVLCGILAGLGLWWNIDSGIAVFGAFLAVMCLELIFSKTRLPALMQLSLFCFSFLFAFFTLLIIFSAQQGCMISSAESLKYIRLFSSSGFMMIPLPKLPAPWCVFAGIYLLGIILGLRSFISGRFNILAKLSIFLSVLGIGLFTYYQGRSHTSNLSSVIWPALMLMFIYADRIIRLVKARLISGDFKMLILPAVFFAVCAMLTIACGSKMIATDIERTCRGILAPNDTCQLEQDIRFILANAGKNKVVNIVSDMSGVYYAETGLRAGINNLCLFELVFIKDWSRIGEELKKAEVPLIISKTRFADIIYKYYKLEAVSKNGELMYLIPITASVGQNK